MHSDRVHVVRVDGNIAWRRVLEAEHLMPEGEIEKERKRNIGSCNGWRRGVILAGKFGNSASYVGNGTAARRRSWQKDRAAVPRNFAIEAITPTTNEKLRPTEDGSYLDERKPCTGYPDNDNHNQLWRRSSASPEKPPHFALPLLRARLQDCIMVPH